MKLIGKDAESLRNLKFVPKTSTPRKRSSEKTYRTSEAVHDLVETKKTERCQ